jgi:hypothetical protein
VRRPNLGATLLRDLLIVEASLSPAALALPRTEHRILSAVARTNRVQRRAPHGGVPFMKPDHPDIVSAKGSRENPSLSLETE